MKQKRIMSKLLVFTLLLSLIQFDNYGYKAYAAEQQDTSGTDEVIQPYSDVREMDLSGYDFKDKVDLLYTLSFDTYTKWPDKDKMPEGFDPVKLMEQGKDPGLGIRKLQKEGYTGKGVTVAYVDQHLLLGHEAYQNVNLHNYEIQTTPGSSPSMHGPAVLSLLAGKEIGIVPDSEVYFFGHDGNTDDNEYEAQAFEKIVELNKSLPEDKKIRIVGMSHTADDGLDPGYAKHLREAEQKARESGIIVVDVNCVMATCGVSGFQDREDYRNYDLSEWEKRAFGGSSVPENNLIVPADHRTTAVGYKNDTKQYAYFAEGGFSWGVPYITGVIAMALQINPKLTEEEAFKYLHMSGDKYFDGDVINPERFLNLVKQIDQDETIDDDYRFILYNKNKVTKEDQKAIGEYADRFSDGIVNIIKDVSEYKSAADLYDMLKTVSKTRYGNLKGIQIFGTSEDVPSFEVHDQIQEKDKQKDNGIYQSDFFYSNLQNDSDNLRKNFSIYKAFQDKLKISFIPEWTVARLPLTKGEIAGYLNRNKKYVSSVEKNPFGNIVNFSNPLMKGTKQRDDFSYFLKERVDHEFSLLTDRDYKLYGNKQGVYPVNTEVTGDFTSNNISKENKEGIKEFIINAYGDKNGINNYIFTSEDGEPKKSDVFLNKGSINRTLSSNYYDLDLWTDYAGNDLGGSSLIHKAMADGKCMSAMAASSYLSKDGVNNDASLNDMKNNNFYYFYLKYFNNRVFGQSRSASFQAARQAYIQEILSHTDDNYQENLHNVLSYHYFGLIEYWDCNAKISDTDKPLQVEFTADPGNKGFKINTFQAVKLKDKLEFSINCESTRDCDYGVFNPPNADVIRKVGETRIKQGTNTITFTFDAEEYFRLLSLDNISIKFGFDENGSYIYFKPDQLKALFK